MNKLIIDSRPVVEVEITSNKATEKTIQLLAKVIIGQELNFNVNYQNKVKLYKLSDNTGYQTMKWYLNWIMQVAIKRGMNIHAVYNYCGKSVLFKSSDFIK